MALTVLRVEVTGGRGGDHTLLSFLKGKFDTGGSFPISKTVLHRDLRYANHNFDPAREIKLANFPISEFYGVRESLKRLLCVSSNPYKGRDVRVGVRPYPLTGVM